MRFFNKELKDKADSRVAKMETPALVGWLDSSIMNFGQSFDEWRFRNGNKETVTEAITAINSIWDELERRS
jgi:hypothetical protein